MVPKITADGERVPETAIDQQNIRANAEDLLRACGTLKNHDGKRQIRRTYSDDRLTTGSIVVQKSDA